MQRQVTVEEYLAAIRQGDADTVRAYLAMPERNVNARDGANGSTALMLAVGLADEEIVRLIIEAEPSLLVANHAFETGAYVRGGNRPTPRIYPDLTGGNFAGARFHPTPVAQVVRLPGDDLSRPTAPVSGVAIPRFMDAARDGNVDVVDRYHRENAMRPDLFSTVRDPDNHNMTALMLAAQNGHIDVVQILLLHVDTNEQMPLNAGIDPNERDDRDLLAAARSHNQEIVDKYIHQNLNSPGVLVNLQAAARMAHDQQHYDLAAHLTELITDLQQSEQENIAQAAAAKPSSDIKYNANETRLMMCKFAGEIPEKLCCPVATGIMCDPVTVSTGITYERSSLVQLMGEKSWCVCPFTRERIMRAELENNSDVCLMRYIENFVRAQENREYVWDVAALLTCPLTRELFVDPVTVACGLTFEREALKKWFAEKNNPEEMVWKGSYIIKLSEINTNSNIAIKSLVSDYRDRLNAEAQQVRAARIRMFDKPDKVKNLDGGDSTLSPGKRK